MSTASKADKKYTITVVGIGCVGLLVAMLLFQHHEVFSVDIIPEKMELINNRKSLIRDGYIEKYLEKRKKLGFTCNV